MSAKTQLTARLIEVFSAIQGEGLNVGVRQLFIRFALCDLRCYFCDSAHTWNAPGSCDIEQTPGRRDFETHPNPVSLSRLLAWVERLNQPGLHESISLTGGEPLLQAPFLAEFLPQLRQLTGLPIYLETGGHRPEQLAKILPDLDSVGMDIKLPSVSGENRWQAHAEFLQQCCDARIDVFVKLIISSTTDPAELERAAELVVACSPSIPVVLQPVTPLETPLHLPVLPPIPERVLEWQALMKRHLKSVRVVPQTHKLIGQL
ncbi:MULTISPECIES: 7-carboxy-7-deazaguanine synthase QueE [unclassified Coleofasciculus]|uniref:7-carboxy-7-deazaguanine synthase QueE n=1 Tax=unclassified Coleofasciculus TaxID=2692782 RepID=UPI00187F41F8|nr:MULTISPECIES: 7-carboxy-7-deazaguanine synthase QueE [unclassified Coleofasciculus]MBE9125098.1 7-carboxy-7-deazaguanine synthase QueE [Coleofasciculus sp. LEGE 07081]MBE9150101.1 7-carboxy-7-deazaguanine synthase QueE [Coleofasciculus sp. LEGE 07092]